MKTLKLIGLVPLAMFAAVSFAQDDNRAVPRGSGGGSSASDAGSRHSGGSSGSSSTQSSGSSSGGSSSQFSDGGQRNSRSSDAARRRPRPGTGTGDRDRYGNDRSYRGYPYSNYYYDPYYYSGGYPGSRYGYYGYGLGYGYYDYGYSYGDYYGYYPSNRSYRYRSGNIGQVRTLVEPSKARVYVDGYYAGIVDDFDGLLQRLNVSPGRHEITFRLEGYRSHTFSIYANRDQTLKLRYDMVKGSGESRDSVGEEDRRSDADADRDRDRDRELEIDRDSARDSGERGREVDSDRPSPSPTGDRNRGEVVFEIEPGDASVYVDGEFYGKAAQLTRLELPVGRHRVEVVRPGYKTEETEINVLGETTRVVVKLGRR